MTLRCTSRAIERKLASLAFYLTRPQVNLGVDMTGLLSRENWKSVGLR